MLKFTPAAAESITEADKKASMLGRTLTGSEHMLLGFLKTERSIASKLLTARGMSYDSVLKQMYGIKPGILPDTAPVEGITPQLEKIIERSGAEAAKCGSLFIGTEHILLSLISESECAASKIIISHGIRLSEIYTDIMSVIGVKGAVRDKHKKREKTYLKQYGTDLCELALSGKLDPVIGRKDEIERIIRILCRKTKNNPCLIGEAGVGKTAVVEGIARLIAENNVPYQLRGKSVIAADISSMLSGSKFRGEFEERLKGIISEASSDPDIILFIDEIHMIVGAGAAEGAVDAANILKPALGRADIRLIGATTYAEYKKSIGTDAALCRRFQTVNIAEPSQKETLEILKGIRSGFESHHRVKITDRALEAAVRLSSRYIKDRFLPDKAIDLVDEACASFLSEQEGSETDNPTLILSGNENDFPLYSHIVDEDLIIQITSKSVGVPCEISNEKSGSNNLSEKLGMRIFGQNNAIKEISSAVNRMRAGFCSGNRPNASFLFYGPSGVGKTEMCRALALELCGTESAFIRLDMSEYSEKHTVSRLIGSPPGYIGYGESGLLTDAVRKRPYSVICFDYADKAHTAVLSLIRQILEEGELTDSLGVKVDFTNSFIILSVTTEAAGHTRISGFSDVNDNSAAKNDFLLNGLTERVDRMIEFLQLKNEALLKIAKSRVSEIIKKSKRNGLDILIEDGVANYIAALCGKGGANSIRINTLKMIEEPLADMIVSQGASSVSITVSDGKIKIQPIDKTQ